MGGSALSISGDAFERVERALAAFRGGRGALVVDDNERENEGDLVFAAESLTCAQMAMLIRECSGIVCLCLTADKVKSLDLPLMVERNTSSYGTAFTVSVEAARGVTTGVSAADRVATVKAAVADDAVPSDLNRPGHVFPLVARPGGVLERPEEEEAGEGSGRAQGRRGLDRRGRGLRLDARLALAQVVAADQLLVELLADLRQFNRGVAQEEEPGLLRLHGHLVFPLAAPDETLLVEVGEVGGRQARLVEGLGAAMFTL